MADNLRIGYGQVRIRGVVYGEIRRREDWLGSGLGLVSSLENTVNNLPPQSGMFIGRFLSGTHNHVTCTDQLRGGRYSSPVDRVTSGVTLSTTFNVGSY